LNKDAGVQWIGLEAIAVNDGAIPAKEGWTTWIYQGEKRNGLLPIPVEVIVGPPDPADGDAEATEGMDAAESAAKLEVGMEMGGASLVDSVIEASAEVSVEVGDEAEADEEELEWDDAWDEDAVPEGVRCQCKAVEYSETETKLNVSIEDKGLGPGWNITVKVSWGTFKELEGAAKTSKLCEGKEVVHITGITPKIADFALVMEGRPPEPEEGSSRPLLLFKVDSAQSYRVRAEEASYTEMDAAYWEQVYGCKAEMGILAIDSEDPQFKKPHPNEVFTNAAKRAETLEGCIGFGINRKQGVEWYSVDCFDERGHLAADEDMKWVTWLFRGGASKGLRPCPSELPRSGWSDVKKKLLHIGLGFKGPGGTPLRAEGEAEAEADAEEAAEEKSPAVEAIAYRQVT